jgi:hypothetical protein
MAIEIKTIPVLHGEAAARFVEAAYMRPTKIVNTCVHNLYVREKEIETLVVVQIAFIIARTIIE